MTTARQVQFSEELKATNKVSVPLFDECLNYWAPYDVFADALRAALAA